MHRFAGRVPLLGVCLGHQAIALAHGGRGEVAGQVMHGRTSTVRHDGAGVFAGLGHTLEATRYHSLVVAEPLPDDLVTTAVAVDHGYVMGLRHRTLPVEGVQFHPESIMTTGGLAMMGNFLATARRQRGGGPQRGRHASLRARTASVTPERGRCAWPATSAGAPHRGRAWKAAPPRTTTERRGAAATSAASSVWRGSVT